MATAIVKKVGQTVQTPKGTGVVVKALKHAYLVRYADGTERQVWSWDIK